MPHGAPDYNVTNAGDTTYRVTDLGELAARLGSIDTFDRRGDVVWLDDFEDGIIKWETVVTGAGSAVASFTALARNGAKCAQLHTGAVAGATAMLFHDMPPPRPSRIGIEFSAKIDTAFVGLFGEATYFDGTNRYEASVVFTRAGGLLQYYNQAHVLTTIASGLTLSNAVTLFHTFKLVFDVVTKEYVRLLVDGTTYLLTGIPMRQVADAAFPRLQLWLHMTGSAAAAADIWIDDPIVTQNEPA